MLRYLDSSALVKLVVPERESQGLLEHLTAPAGDALSSALSVIEVSRAVARAGIGDEAMPRLEAVFATLELRRMDAEIIHAAARLEAPDIRSLDAIHLATAIELGDELGELVAYDRRLVQAAHERGIRTASPS